VSITARRGHALSIRPVDHPRLVRRKRWGPSAEDRQLLTEHLFYEVQMTFFLAGQLDSPTGSRIDVSLRNAQIEAFALHLRQLTEFLWGEPERERQERHAFAEDYFPEGEWARLRPELPAILVPDSPGFARLGYGEAWLRPADKVWDLVTQAFAIAPVVRRFADTVDHEQFTPGYVSGMRICAETFLNGQRPSPADLAA
jgi:hypothetical protein